MSYGLGVDLGTTYSAAARYRNGATEMFSLGHRSTVVPSAVLVTPEGEFLVGEAALRRGATAPERLAREFKRRIGDSVPVILGGTPLSAEALSARLLRWIVDQVSQQEGGPPDQIALTYPANWGLFKQELLAQVIRLAEVGGAVTLTEPDAAAISYAATERVRPGEIVAVYDLGGGTFDAAILRKTGTGFELLGEPEGIEHRGGVDFDEAVFAHVNRALDGELDNFPVDDPVVAQAVARLRRDCVDAKEALSSDTDVSIPVVLPHLSTEVRLTRSELEAMVRPALDDTVAALRRAIASAGLTPDRTDRVLLVGGSSRMPVVGQLVAASLGRPYFVDAHPKYGVALGAARMVGEAWTTAIVPAVQIEPPAMTPPPAGVGASGSGGPLPPPPGPPGRPLASPAPPPAAPAPPPENVAPPPAPRTPGEPPEFASAPMSPTGPGVVAGPRATPPPSPGWPSPGPQEVEPAPMEPTRSGGGVATPPGAGRAEPEAPPGGPPQERPDGAWRKRQVRRGLAAAAAAVVAAGMVAGVVRLTNDGGGNGGQTEDEQNGEEAPEAPTVEPAGTTAVGSFPDGMAVEGDNLWLTATFGVRDGTEDLYLLDLASGEVEESFVVDGEPIGLLVAEGSLWVALRAAGEVARMDPATGATITTIPTPGRPVDLSFGAGAVWAAATDGILYRIDPGDNSVQVVNNQLTPDLSSVAATDEAIYVSYGVNPGTVAAIDPETFEVLRSVQIDGDPDDLGVGDSGIWVAVRSGNTVKRIDAESFEVTAEVQVGAAPAGIAVDGDRIWVINNESSSLSLIDGPSAEVLSTITVGGGPLTVVTSPGRVWVSLRDENTVARIDVSD